MARSIKQSLKKIEENTNDLEQCLNVQSVLLYEKIETITDMQIELASAQDKLKKAMSKIENRLNKRFNECMKEWCEIADKKKSKLNTYYEK